MQLIVFWGFFFLLNKFKTTIYLLKKYFIFDYTYYISDPITLYYYSFKVLVIDLVLIVGALLVEGVGGVVTAIIITVLSFLTT